MHRAALQAVSFGLGGKAFWASDGGGMRAIPCWDIKHKDYGCHTHFMEAIEVTFKYIPAEDRPIAIPLSLLERLLRRRPCYYDDDCTYCGGNKDSYRSMVVGGSWHREDCPAEQARKLIEEAKK
jgi:hypothetical protein